MREASVLRAKRDKKVVKTLHIDEELKDTRVISGFCSMT